jgi:hypothetical protein
MVWIGLEKSIEKMEDFFFQESFICVLSANKKVEVTLCSFCSLQKAAGRVYFLPPWACGFSSSSHGWISWYVLIFFGSNFLCSWISFQVFGLSKSDMAQVMTRNIDIFIFFTLS